MQSFVNNVLIPFDEMMQCNVLRFRVLPRCSLDNSRSLFTQTLSKRLPRDPTATSQFQTPKTDSKIDGNPTGPEGVYVHLPFCKRRCFYCDFPIQVIGKQDIEASRSVFSDYIHLLETEIQRSPLIGASTLHTISFGGGTPSLIPPKDLARIVKTLKNKFSFANDVEISLEADPGTFDLRKLQEYVEIGVSRFSLGVQSFDDDVLRNCGRSHSLQDVQTAIEDLQRLQPPSWSLDLISGLPKVDTEQWKLTLNRALDAQPDHLSIYDLQVEASTAFGRWYVPGVAPLPCLDTCAEMYSLAVEALTQAGFEHYEISNFAKEGHRSKHNLLYWKNRPFYAFGLGATSCTNGVRFTRPKRMLEYASWVEEMPQSEWEPFSWKEDIFETLLLHLRLKDGLNLDLFERLHGSEALVTLLSASEEFLKQGLMESMDQREADLKESKISNIRLKDPEGFLISNEILSSIFTYF